MLFLYYPHRTPVNIVQSLIKLPRGCFLALPGRYWPYMGAVHGQRGTQRIQQQSGQLKKCLKKQYVQTSQQFFIHYLPNLNKLTTLTSHTMCCRKWPTLMCLSYVCTIEKCLMAWVRKWHVLNNLSLGHFRLLCALLCLAAVNTLGKLANYDDNWSLSLWKTALKEGHFAEQITFLNDLANLFCFFE